MTHIHILGLSGTFMSGLALLAREAGFKVTGSDENCYPPVSDLLASKGIQWVEGYEDATLALASDCVIVGNAIRRGMPVIEAVLEKGKSYTSGPQWLAENILSRYQVIAVAGTHGKTTATSMLAWILDRAGLKPGFLIGGVAPNFQSSAALGSGEWFVIEADEYDSAFFDKRPKFMHYRPNIAVLNNLEFDHADIYPDLASIQQQFHYLLRTIPSSGKVIKPKDDEALNQVLSQGRYSALEEFSIGESGAEWSAQLMDEAGQRFSVYRQAKKVAEVNWSLLGRFNVENGLAAIIASACIGVDPAGAAEALNDYIPVKRRLEMKSNRHGMTIYDDFAHHPTAIAKTIQALKSSQRHQRILVIMEFASFTMRSGYHLDQMANALAGIDKAYILQPKDFSLNEALKGCDCTVLPDSNDILNAVLEEAKSGDAILIMSNRGFDNIHQKLIERLDERANLSKL